MPKKYDDWTLGDADFKLETTISRRIVHLSREINRVGARGTLTV